jgi:hypothetical protein
MIFETILGSMNDAVHARGLSMNLSHRNPAYEKLNGCAFPEACSRTPLEPAI